MTNTTVSLRAAAKALEMPPTSLTRWLMQEPSLAAAVVGQPGPRQAMEIDLECLQHAWAALQGCNTPTEELSERERLRRERRQRLYWQGQELKQQVLALEQQYVLAAEVDAARTMLHEQIQAAVEGWVITITATLVELDLQARYQAFSRDMNDLLTSLAATPILEVDDGAENRDISYPGQSAKLSRIQIEYYRTRLHQLKAQIHSKEVLPAADVKAKAWKEARLLRDQLLAIPARCAALADQPDALHQEVMACLRLK